MVNKEGFYTQAYLGHFKKDAFTSILFDKGVIYAIKDIIKVGKYKYCRLTQYFIVKKSNNASFKMFELTENNQKLNGGAEKSLCHCHKVFQQKQSTFFKDAEAASKV